MVHYLAFNYIVAIVTRTHSI